MVLPGRPQKLPEDLSPMYKKKLESLSEPEADIRRARQADHVYYCTIRKRVKMTEGYVRANEELRERILAEAMREAEAYRQRDRKTWQQKAEAMGFTRNAKGEWEQDSKILRRYNKLKPIPATNAYEENVQEKEIPYQGNPSLTTIMVVLNQLGSNLNRSELESVNRKVQELICADEERNESYDSVAPTKTSSPIAPTSDTATLEHVLIGAIEKHAEEYRRKRKRSQSCSADQKEGEELNPSRLSKKGKEKGRQDVIDITHSLAATPEICDADLMSINIQPHTQKTVPGIFSGSIDMGSAAQPLGSLRQSEHMAIKAPTTAGPPQIQRPPIEVDKQVKREPESEASSKSRPSKPLRTGFFDNVKWE